MFFLIGGGENLPEESDDDNQYMWFPNDTLTFGVLKIDENERIQLTGERGGTDEDFIVNSKSELLSDDVIITADHCIFKMKLKGTLKSIIFTGGYPKTDKAKYALTLKRERKSTGLLREGNENDGGSSIDDEHNKEQLQRARSFNRDEANEKYHQQFQKFLDQQKIVAIEKKKADDLKQVCDIA